MLPELAGAAAQEQLDGAGALFSLVRKRDGLEHHILGWACQCFRWLEGVLRYFLDFFLFLVEVVAFGAYNYLSKTFHFYLLRFLNPRVSDFPGESSEDLHTARSASMSTTSGAARGCWLGFRIGPRKVKTNTQQITHHNTLIDL